MKKRVLLEWLKRLLGLGALAATRVIAHRTGSPELGDLMGDAVTAAGGYLLIKSMPVVLPTRKGLAKAAKAAEKHAAGPFDPQGSMR